MTTPSVFLARVASAFGIELSDLCGGSLLPSHVRARKLFVYICRMHRNMTYGEIAAALGTRDKSKVRRLYESARRAPDVRTHEFTDQET